MLADLFWVGPLLLATAFAASTNALHCALDLSRSLNDPRLRTAALVESEEGVPSIRPSHRFLVPQLATTLLLAAPLSVALLLWIIYWQGVAVLANVAYGLGFALALVAAALRWRIGRPLRT